MSSPVMIPQRRRSLVGPIVLIILGALLLLGTLGVVTDWWFLARWWPLLLIALGALRLFEYYSAKREGTQASVMGAGAVTLIVFVVIFGGVFSTADHVRNKVNWSGVHDAMGGGDDDFMGMFGKNFTYEDQLEKDLPAGTSLKVVSDRGSIAVNTWDDPKIKVVVHKRVFAANDGEANKVNDQTKPTVEIANGVATVNANTQGGGQKGVVTDLEIFVPKKVAVDIAGRRGDVNVSGREAEVKVSASQGDVVLDQITGNVTTQQNKGSFRISQINGNVTANGRFDDLVAMDVAGGVIVNGDVFGEVKLSKISKGVQFHSSRTDLELARLDGDLDLDSHDLRASNVIGPTTLNVRAKDVNLESIIGPIHIQGEKSDISLQVGEKLPLGQIEVSTNTGDVRVTLPSKATFQIQGSTNHGDATTDFSELATSDNNGRGTVNGSVGKGATKITINTNAGDIDVRKGTS